MGLKVFSICLKICLKTLERGEMSITQCSVGPFSAILQPRNVYEVEFTYTFSAGKTTKKSQKYFDLSTFNQDLNHSKL